MFFKKNNILIFLLIYLSSILIGTILYIALFWIDFFNDADVLFLKSLCFLLFISTLLIISLTLLKIKILKMLTYRDIIIITLLFFTLNSFLYILVPFNVSRSVSVMIVGYLYKHQDKLFTGEEIDDHINQLYFKDEAAVQRRLSEQVKIGNVLQIDGRYKLTPKGIESVRLMGLITSLYRTQKNYAQ